MRGKRWISIFATIVIVISMSLSFALALTSAEESALLTELNKNQNAWHVAHNAYKAAAEEDPQDTATMADARATMTRLNQRNDEIRALLGLDYDPVTGETSGTTTDGGIVVSTGSTNDSNQNHTVTINITTPTGEEDQISTGVYSVEALTIFLQNGGTIEQILAAYNYTGNELGENGGYGGWDEVTSTVPEMAVLQMVTGLSATKIAAIQAQIQPLKESYAVLALDYNELADEYFKALAAGDAEAAAQFKAQMEKISAQMTELHEQAEAIRAQYNYTAEINGIADGATLAIWNAMFGVGPTSPFPTSPDNPDDPGPDNNGNRFTITSSCGKGGTITPLGVVYVESGSNQSYLITPNRGYTIDKLIIDGQNISAAEVYRFTNINSSHTIHAVFVPNPTADPPELNSDTLNSDGTIKAGYGFTANWTLHTDGCEYIESVSATWNFGGGGNVSMEPASGGTYQFPVNQNSKVGARKIYIPVTTEDGSYWIQFRAVVVYTDDDGNEIKKTVESDRCQIVVKGVMYEDDFTGDNR